MGRLAPTLARFDRCAPVASLALWAVAALAPSSARAQSGPTPAAAPQTSQQPQTPYGPAVAPGAGAPYGGSPTSGAPYGSPPAPRAASDADSGRPLEFFYARAGAGGAFVSLDALSGAGLALQHLNGVGGALELGLGARLLLVTIGPRARALVLSSATLWQLGGEIALRLPLGRWDPFVSLQGGATFGSKSRDDVDCGAAPNCRAALAASSDSVSISGGDVGLAGGADYYLSPMFSLGGDVGVMMLLLSREAVTGTGDVALDESASMTGLGVRLGAHAALHF